MTVQKIIRYSILSQIVLFILELFYVLYIFLIRNNLQGQTRFIAIFGLLSLTSATLAVINIAIIIVKRKIIYKKKFYIIFNILSFLLNGVVGGIIYFMISVIAYLSGPPLL